MRSRTTGACCTYSGLCEQTTFDSCYGFFHGEGTTCGNTLSSICKIPGVCCIKTDTGVYQEVLTCFECIGFTGAQTKFGGRYSTPQTTNCSLLFDNKGACCKNNGQCEELTESECKTLDGYYQGSGISCVDPDGNKICSSGIGPCCIEGNCSIKTWSDCFASNGLYLGSGKTCSNFTCPKTVSCLGYINGVPIKCGSEFAGGIVAGTYTPGSSEILGAKEIFSPVFYSPNITGITYDCSLYESFIDHTAYGVNKNCLTTDESYVIVVYPYDIIIDSNKTLKNTETYMLGDTETFAWGGTGSAWGPLLNDNGNYFDLNIGSEKYTDTHLKYSEGYWSTGFTGTTQAAEELVIQNTFPPCYIATSNGSCGVCRVFNKSPYSLNGHWSRSWGLWNTIRAISANNTFYRKSNDPYENYKWWEFTTPQITAFTVARLVSDGLTSAVQGITSNSSSVSDWYIPSHDEMAFIAARTYKTYSDCLNLNEKLVVVGQALNGTYWTSTGSFNYTKNEGGYTGGKLTPGSVAFAFNIDANGNLDNYKVYKHNRSEQHKVRPIRMIRCDGQIPSDVRLWKIPKTFTQKNKTVNQTVKIEIFKNT